MPSMKNLGRTRERGLRVGPPKARSTPAAIGMPAVLAIALFSCPAERGTGTLTGGRSSPFFGFFLKTGAPPSTRLFFHNHNHPQPSAMDAKKRRRHALPPPFVLA